MKNSALYYNQEYSPSEATGEETNWTPVSLLSQPTTFPQKEATYIPFSICPLLE